MAYELTIIIVTYNSKDVIAQCLDSILSNKYGIIVVNNDSPDGTADYIRQRFPLVEVMEAGGNIGFGRANNLALAKVNTPYALLLNPDVIASEASVLSLLSKMKKKKDVAIAAPVTGLEFHAPEKRIAVRKEWVSGAAMMLDMQKIREVGFFDKNIFLFSEEVDLCRRVRDKGYKILLYKNIHMPHRAGSSSSNGFELAAVKYWHMAWGRCYFNFKHHSTIWSLVITLAQLGKYAFKLLTYRISGDKLKAAKYKALLAGAFSYVTGVKAFDKNGNPEGF